MPQLPASSLHARLPRLAAGVALAVASLAAHADLSANQVRVDYYLDTTGTAQTTGTPVNVGAGVEYAPFTVQAGAFTPEFAFGSIDFSANRIDIVFDAGNYAPCPADMCGFDGLRITNLSTGLSFKNYVATLGSATTGTVLSQDGNGDLWLDFRALDPYTTGSLQVNLAPVPEPGTLALMLSGGALLLRRRRG
jgi:hypothetical protein